MANACKLLAFVGETMFPTPLPAHQREAGSWA
jgi:hypothetical protein